MGLNSIDKILVLIQGMTDVLLVFIDFSYMS
jgi:hypothetical protein